jgi:3-methylcrotonyl-CoA carboxylase beta subunit
VDAHNPQFKANTDHFQGLLSELRERQSIAAKGGGTALLKRHIERGKIPVRERIDLLLDPFSPFLELSPLAAWGMYGGGAPAAGIVTGIGLIHGLPCMLIANDATVKGGSFFHETVKKHLRAQEIAWLSRLPCVYLVDCGGAYLPEQDRVFPDKGHFGTAFYNQCRMSADGLPQLAAVFGACTAGGAYIPVLCDEVVIVRESGYIHLGGPPIVKAAINEIVDSETLGGAQMHTRISGVSDYLAENEAQALKRIRDIIGKLGLAAVHEISPCVSSGPPLLDSREVAGIINNDPRVPYDAREIIARLVDESDLQEFKPEWGDTLVCGTARVCGHPVGILANNGVLFSEAALKGAHFIQLCNQRRIPLLFLQNVTGFMVGSEAERNGIAKHSAKLVYAMSTAQVPRYTVITGGSYGAGNYGMCGRGFAPHFLFTWPNSRIATMSPEIAATVLTDLRRQSLRKTANDAAAIEELATQTRLQFTQQSDPYYATARLWDDGIIEPEDTRLVIGFCLTLGANAVPRSAAPSPVYRM